MHVNRTMKTLAAAAAAAAALALGLGACSSTGGSGFGISPYGLVRSGQTINVGPGSSCAPAPHR